MTFRTPRVSIGLPVYNGERFLPEALDSLLSQSYEDFEITISDNASTDRTQEISRDYGLRDQRIHYTCNESNLGVYKNFNRVFEVSSGEYFKWAAADDVCQGEFLARCVAVLDNDPTVVLAYPRTRFINGQGEPLDWNDPGWDLRSEAAQERLRYVLYAGHWVNCIHGLIRAQHLAKTRLFPLYNSGDYRLIGELSLLGKFYEIPECLFLRRIHPAASSQNTDVEWQTEFYTGRSGRPSLPFWHLCLDHSVTIMHSGLNLSQKLFLGGSLLERMLLGKRHLFEELEMVSRYYIKRFSSLS